ncbi:MAG: helix-turn-helix transcriptional regulator [Chloroflexi bacterium]|nr:helix-turn-helix transcriptional regulator [Chloroflexota bacterium]
MLDQVTNLESDSDFALPTASLDLSTRMRDLRTRQGLKQSEVARRMRLDPSIPSLWEQGKRMVPANRLRALADALEVSVEELLEGVSGAQPAASGALLDESALPPPPHATSVVELIDERTVRPLPVDEVPLLRLVPQEVVEDLPTPPTDGEVLVEQWVAPERPPLEGWIPDGWQPTDRIQDITPSLPDGYWLDPVKLERAAARQLLRSRLCADDQSVVGARHVPGAALAERLYRHCGREDGFLVSSRLPLAESIFRCVLTADHGGLTDGALVEMLRERSGAVPVSSTLLRRMRDTVRAYPIRRVDADLFGGRR